MWVPGFFVSPIRLIRPDAVDDGAGAVILVAGAEAAAAFVGVGNVAALDEDGWAAGFVEDSEVLALAGVSVFELEPAEEAEVDVGGEALALGAVVVGFHAVVAGGGMGIEVDTDEDGVAVAVGDGSALVEGEIAVGAPSHGDRHAFGLEHGLDAACDSEGEIFLVDAAAVGPFVFAAVAGVDDDTRDFPGLGLPGGSQKQGACE